jgi:hypothetical protein
MQVSYQKKEADTRSLNTLFSSCPYHMLAIRQKSLLWKYPVVTTTSVFINAETDAIQARQHGWRGVETRQWLSCELLTVATIKRLFAIISSIDSWIGIETAQMWQSNTYVIK